MKFFISIFMGVLLVQSSFASELATTKYFQTILDEHNQQWHQISRINRDTTNINNDINADMVLGHGYSIEKGRMLPRSCMNEGKFNKSISENSLQLNRRWTRAEMKKHFGFDVGLNINLKMFNVSNKTEFVYNSVENVYSEDFSFFNQIKIKREYINPKTIPHNGKDTFFQRDAQNAIDSQDPKRFKNICGHEVINTIDYGGALYMNVKLIFHNRRDKATFKKRTSVSRIPLFQLGAALKSSMEFFLDTGDIEIMALQIGGNATRLNQILRSGDPNNPFPIVRCSFNDIDSCQKMIEALADYASNEENGFPAQLDPSSPHYVEPRALEHGTTVYTPWNNGTNPAPNPVLDPEIMKARRDIAKDYEQASEDYFRSLWLELKTHSSTQKEKIKKAGKILLDNFSIYYPFAAEACFVDTDEKEVCLQTKQYIYNDFINDPERRVDRDLLYPAYEEWKLDYTLLYYPQQRTCKASWIFNSKDGDKNLYDVYATCDNHPRPNVVGIGHLWQTEGDNPKFVMSAYSEKYGFDTFYGERNGLQIYGLYLSENRGNNYDEWTERSLISTLERKFEGGIINKDPDTYDLQDKGKNYE